MKHAMFLAAILTGISGVAVAAPQPSETVTVTAPYVVIEKEAKANLHQKLMTVSLSGTVGFGDLNLGKAQDIATLKARIRKTSENLCKQLDQQYPGFVPVTNQDCPKAATDEAMNTVNLLASAYAHP